MNTETIGAIIDTIQANTRDAVALLRLVADEYERAHNNVQGLVESILPDYKVNERVVKTPQTVMPTPIREMATQTSYVGAVQDKPVQDEKGNFEVVPGTGGIATALNISAEVRKVMDKYYKEDREFLLKDLYAEVRKLIPDATNNAMYYGYSTYIKSMGWDVTKHIKDNKTYLVLVPKH